MVVIALAVALLAGPVAKPQVPPAPAAAVPQVADAPVALEDVEVTGTPLETMIRDFVGQVAAPNRHRGLARWRTNICVGVANLRNESAHYIADRISTVAEDIGLNPGGPGCSPNVVIVATDDSDALARQLVAESRLAFRPGGSGMDRGGAALAAFEASDAPVRWWQVAMPIDSQTGERAVRLPGDCKNPCVHADSYAPVTPLFVASRLNTQIVDSLIRTIVIVDVSRMSDVSTVQLADYLAMVTLAQIDPEADTSAYSSILNVFDRPDAVTSLTDWDKAYLDGLYDAERVRANRRSGRLEIVSAIRRAHQDLHSANAD
jgi:hypothetical protein